MGKSVRSKIKKRLRTVKRHAVSATSEVTRFNNINSILSAASHGELPQDDKPANAFLHPDVENAAFPQAIPVKPIDFRSCALPESGYTIRGNFRKKFTQGPTDGTVPKEIHEEEMEDAVPDLMPTGIPALESMPPSLGVRKPTGDVMKADLKTKLKANAQKRKKTRSSKVIKFHP
eukprot:GILK01007115.1.p1 GENE.GILK01007115.1~~GILK01007115.1.p1  ORF type:complete len:202 (+),score=27.48 GILK01007115.1:84-608(+)